MGTISRISLCTGIGALVGYFYMGDVPICAIFGLIVGVTWPLIMGGPDRDKLLGLLEYFD